MIQDAELMAEIREAMFSAESEPLADVYEALLGKKAVYLGSAVWIVEPISELTQEHTDFLTDLISLDYSQGVDVLTAWEKGRQSDYTSDLFYAEHLQEAYPKLNGRMEMK